MAQAAGKTLQILELLKQNDAFLCTVESCTGGLLVNELTDVSGASEVIWGGLVTYDNSAKQDLLGIPPAQILTYGAVSAEVALAMAEGGLRVMKAACLDKTLNRKTVPALFVTVSLTGIAGPTGGSEQKPVGLCFIGVSLHRTDSRESRSKVIEVRSGQNSRAANKRTFADAAMDLLLTTLREAPL